MRALVAEPGQQVGVVEAQVEPLPERLGLALEPGQVGHPQRRVPEVAVATTGVALPVVVVPPCQPTTVPIVTTDGPGGSTSATCSSTVPSGGRRAGRAGRGAPRTPAPGPPAAARRCRPSVSTLPRSAVRSSAGSTAATTAAVAGSARRPGRPAASARSTSTGEPSVSCRLPRTSSVHSTRARGRRRPGRRRPGRPSYAGRAARTTSSGRDAERGQRLRVQPHHAEPGVEGGRVQDGGERQHARTIGPRRATEPRTRRGRTTRCSLLPVREARPCRSRARPA